MQSLIAKAMSTLHVITYKALAIDSQNQDTQEIELSFMKETPKPNHYCSASKMSMSNNKADFHVKSNSSHACISQT